jgi:hypothetical protein
LTSYFFDEGRLELLATWDTGVGGRACMVTGLPQGSDPTPGIPAGSLLALWLTGLSEAAWRTYTHGGRFLEPDEVNTEAWRISEGRKSFEDVLAVITNPGKPDIVSYSPLLWNAERIGHLLAQIGDQELTAALRCEVETELDAVASAELGDLSGRAVQAVVLSRAAASPPQVQAAWDLLATDLFGSTASLKTALDPTSASIAAVAWLRGAAQIASDATDGRSHWTDVIREADDIEALPVETPTDLLERLDAGQSPADAIHTLVRDAMRVADGHLPDPDTVMDKIADLMQLAERHPESRQAFLDDARLCRLDPRRPGPDLLEDLLSAIWGCYLLWRDYVWATGDDTGEGHTAGDYDEDDDAATRDQYAAEEAALQERFAAAVQDIMLRVDRLAL